MRVSIYQQTFERNKLTKMLLREKRELREILERFALRLQVSQFLHWLCIDGFERVNWERRYFEFLKSCWEEKD